MRQCDNDNWKQYKYVANQPDTKSNPNTNPTIKQHAITIFQLNIVTCSMYRDKFIWYNVIATSVLLSIVTVTMYDMMLCIMHIKTYISHAADRRDWTSYSSSSIYSILWNDVSRITGCGHHRLATIHVTCSHLLPSIHVTTTTTCRPEHAEKNETTWASEQSLAAVQYCLHSQSVDWYWQNTEKVMSQ